MNIPIGSAIQRRLAGIEGVLYKHVGIYIGDEKVIHFYGEGKKDKKAKVIETTLSNFAEGEKISIKTKPQNADHAEAICDEAKLICSDSKNEYNGKYSVMLKNCEDFVKHCYLVKY